MFEIIGITATVIVVVAVIAYIILWFRAKDMGMPD